SRSLLRAIAPANVLALTLLVPAIVPATAQGVSATVVLPGFRGVVRMDTVGTTESVPGSVGQVYAAVRRAFDSLGVAQALNDSTRGLVGNLELRLLRRFAGQPMSRWVDCGVGHTGPTANLYRVHLALLATVSPAPGGGANLKTSVAAGAQALGGPLADPIACQSTGAIETRLTELVRTLQPQR
ncbi:MAG: hypothetical protein ABI910_23570, partial [Gemmatimonadota bacterium]